MKKLQEFYSTLLIKIFVNGFRSQIDVINTKFNKLSNLFNNMVIGSITVNYNILMQNLEFIGFDNNKHKEPLKKLLKQNIENNLL